MLLLMLAGVAEAAPLPNVPTNALPGREREQFGLSPFPQRDLNDNDLWRDRRDIAPARPAARDGKHRCRDNRGIARPCVSPSPSRRAPARIP